MLTLIDWGRGIFGEIVLGPDLFFRYFQLGLFIAIFYGTVTYYAWYPKQSAQRGNKHLNTFDPVQL